MQANIILWLNTWMSTHPLWLAIIPLLSDIFVFTYPFYLIYLYFTPQETTSWWKKIWRKTIDDNTHKINALTIFFTMVAWILSNYLIKVFVTEPRPFHVLQLAVNPKQRLLLSDLPTDTFPSDHATVGMSIAAATLLLWYQQKNTSLIRAWWIFLVFTLIMNISRITLGVHRPADILWGMGVGIIIACVLTYEPVSLFMSQKIYNPLIRFQEYLLEKIKKLFLNLSRF